jgi:Stage II sporulation protein
LLFVIGCSPAEIGELQSALSLPATIKVWRRGLDGSTASCSGRVDTLAFEDYVKGVVPHEWIPSWDAESLKAGAVAARTYAFYWVHAGGKYTCADIDDTTASQVYKDSTTAATNDAVDQTAGQFVANGSGEPIFAEYSAENGDPTADGVDEPWCAGQSVNGHGHGMCQWGSQRWAQHGKSYDWIVAHYYPSAHLVGGGPQYAAHFSGAQAPPAEMTSGDTAVVWLEYVNDGSATWDATNTRVGTSSPHDHASPFFTSGNWLNDHRPTAADHTGYAGGDTGRFSFVVTAPDVQSDSEYTEHFALVQEGVTWFGDETSFTVLVHPKSTPPPPLPSPSPDEIPPTMLHESGCSTAPGAPAPFWPLLLLLALRVRSGSRSSSPCARR